ncbi:hypothetical protein ACFLX7_03780 [Chloroflexota bacterium]
MNRTPKEETKNKQKPIQMEIRQEKIMTLPLPQILDELENYIGRVEEAVKQAQTAAKESREAARQAKISGEKATETAREAADTAVAEVREESARAIDALGTKISDLETELNILKEKVRQEALALDRSFIALKDRHTEESPFLNK